MEKLKIWFLISVNWGTNALTMPILLTLQVFETPKRILSFFFFFEAQIIKKKTVDLIGFNNSSSADSQATQSIPPEEVNLLLRKGKALAKEKVNKLEGNALAAAPNLPTTSEPTFFTQFTVLTQRFTK